MYAFEIEYFLSENPIPSGVTGGEPGSGVKFFGGGLNDDGTISTSPYTPIIDPYVPSVTAEILTDFQLSENLSSGTQFSSYLSFGDPYQDETNTFKKGNFLLLKVENTEGVPHVHFPATPEVLQVADDNRYLYAMTPGSINGSDAHGSFADAFVVLGNSKFEVSSLQTEFEFTEYDHGGITGTASKAKTK